MCESILEPSYLSGIVTHDDAMITPPLQASS